MCPPTHTCYVRPLTDADVGFVVTSSGQKIATDVGDCGSVEDEQTGRDMDVDVGEEDENAASERVGELCQYVFFDIETSLDVSGTHQPYLIIAMLADGTVNKFEGDDCLQEFCDWAFSPTFRNYRFFAHNASGRKQLLGREGQRQSIVANHYTGFDSFFIMCCLRQSYHKVEPTITGGRILELRLPQLSISVVDFFRFCSTALCKLPKLLGLNVTVKKDFFPHVCLQKENLAIFQHYRGPIPEKKYFGVKPVHGQRFIDFEQWYADRHSSGDEYDIDAEAVTYCTQDCLILRLSVFKFRFIFMKLSGGKFDPTRISISMPQSSMQLYR